MGGKVVVAVAVVVIVVGVITLVVEVDLEIVIVDRRRFRGMMTGLLMSGVLLPEGIEV